MRPSSAATQRAIAAEAETQEFGWSPATLLATVAAGRRAENFYTIANLTPSRPEGYYDPQLFIEDAEEIDLMTNPTAPRSLLNLLDYSDGFPTVIETGLPFWERLPGEPLELYRIFTDYRDSLYNPPPEDLLRHLNREMLPAPPTNANNSPANTNPNTPPPALPLTPPAVQETQIAAAAQSTARSMRAGARPVVTRATPETPPPATSAPISQLPTARPRHRVLRTGHRLTEEEIQQTPHHLPGAYDDLRNPEPTPNAEQNPEVGSVGSVGEDTEDDVFARLEADLEAVERAKATAGFSPSYASGNVPQTSHTPQTASGVGDDTDDEMDLTEDAEEAEEAAGTRVVGVTLAPRSLTTSIPAALPTASNNRVLVALPVYGRSIAALSKKYNVPPQSLLAMKSIYCWPQRATCFDTYRRQMEEAVTAWRTQEMESRHAGFARRMLDMVERYMVANPITRPNVALEMMKMAVQIERISNGVPAAGPALPANSRQTNVMVQTVVEGGGGGSGGTDSGRNLFHRILSSPGAAAAAERLAVELSRTAEPVEIDTGRSSP